MVLRKYIYIIFGLLISFIGANAQELVLTQPYSVSQYQNAAAAGSGSFNKRFQYNLRNPVIDGEGGLFRTNTFAYDSRITKDWEPSLNYFGYGLVFVNDRIMNGVMQNNYYTLNLAYHIFFDDDLKDHIAAGLGVTYAQTNLDVSRLRFGDQYNYRDMLTYASSLENIAAYPHNMSFNAALMYTHHEGNKFIQAGAMAYKYDKPNVTYSPFNQASDMSYKAFVNTEFCITPGELDGDEGNSVLLSASYLNSGVKKQVSLGGFMGIKIKKSYDDLYKMYVGCIYKMNQSYSPSLAFIIKRYTVGLSYDTYTNDITAANIKMGAYELTVSKKIGPSKKNDTEKYGGRRMKTLFD